MENERLKSCKVCGAEVAKSAKVCPHCGAKLKKGHPILFGLLALVVLAAVIAATGDDEPKKVESTAPAQSIEAVPAPEEKAPVSEEQITPVPSEELEPELEPEDRNVFYPGETAELRGINVTLVDVTESAGSAYNTPTEGNVFVLCEFEIANESDEEITVSSVMSFEAYCDDYVCNYSFTALLEKGNKNQLDGTVAAGKKMNGVIGYEVPSGWRKLEIGFTPDFWSGKSMTFLAEHE